MRRFIVLLLAVLVFFATVTIPKPAIDHYRDFRAAAIMTEHDLTWEEVEAVFVEASIKAHADAAITLQAAIESFHEDIEKRYTDEFLKRMTTGFEGYLREGQRNIYCLPEGVWSMATDAAGAVANSLRSWFSAAEPSAADAEDGVDEETCKAAEWEIDRVFSNTVISDEDYYAGVRAVISRAGVGYAESYLASLEARGGDLGLKKAEWRAILRSIHVEPEQTSFHRMLRGSGHLDYSATTPSVAERGGGLAVFLATHKFAEITGGYVFQSWAKGLEKKVAIEGAEALARKSLVSRVLGGKVKRAIANKASGGVAAVTAQKLAKARGNWIAAGALLSYELAMSGYHYVEEGDEREHMRAELEEGMGLALDEMSEEILSAYTENGGHILLSTPVIAKVDKKAGLAHDFYASPFRTWRFARSQSSKVF